MTLPEVITAIPNTPDDLEKISNDIFTRLQAFHPAEMQIIIEDLRIKACTHVETLREMVKFLERDLSLVECKLKGEKPPKG